MCSHFSPRFVHALFIFNKKLEINPNLKEQSDSIGLITPLFVNNKRIILRYKGAMNMRLSRLRTSDQLQVKQILRLDYTGIQCHSKKVETGNLYIAIPGTNIDGHHFINEAISRGARAVVGQLNLTDVSVPYFKVENSRKTYALLASAYYNHPSMNHKVIGITGTNGKTTTSYLLKHLIESQGKTCSMFGTVGHYLNGKTRTSVNTTPDPLTLQSLLYESSDEFVVMEASSHGIDQDRITGTFFDVALFTNLSHDHLDYHKSMAQYFQVKSKLFSMLKHDGAAVVSGYCPWGRKLNNLLKEKNIQTYVFGEDEKDHIQLMDVGIDHFTIRDENKRVHLQFPMPGIHNMWNAIQVYLTAKKIGLDPGSAIESLKSFNGVPGRFEKFSHPKNTNVIVDYAHTPDGIKNCLQTARSLTENKLTHIFGFRGNRDHKKRKAMLEISTSICDEVILTLDDLNGESIEHMEQHIDDLIEIVGRGKCKIILDRTKAIEHAWNGGVDGDTIIITGKGPEPYKEVFTLPCTTDRETVNYLYSR